MKHVEHTLETYVYSHCNIKMKHADETHETYR
jgi:hypothetical protein